MKKELLAAIFLVVILISCLVNISYINDLTNELILLVQDAGKQAENENWDLASEKIDEALALLDKNNVYTSIVLPHDTISEATDSLYELTNEINKHDSDSVSGAVQMAISRFEEIASNEQVSVGSVF